MIYNHHTQHAERVVYILEAYMSVFDPSAQQSFITQRVRANANIRLHKHFFSPTYSVLVVKLMSINIIQEGSHDTASEVFFSASSR